MDPQQNTGSIAKVGAALLGMSVAFATFAYPAMAQTELRVTGTGANPPFHFVDPSTNAQRGIAVDIINAVASEMGATVTFGDLTPVAQLEAVLVAGAFDTFAGAINFSPARLEQVAMSIPWYVGTGDGLWVLKSDSTDYHSVDDLRGMAIGAVRGSGFATALEGMPGVFSELRLYDTPAALAQGVMAGEVRGGILNGITASYTLFQGNYPDLQVPSNYRGTIQAGAFYGTPFAKGADELLAAFNSTLAQLMVDGTVQEIFANYGLPWPVVAP